MSRARRAAKRELAKEQELRKFRAAEERKAAEADRRAALSPEERSNEDRRRLLIGLAVVVAIAVLAVIGNMTRSDREPRTPRGELLACNEPLRSGGPYYRGVDPEYDPRMDWDGDGVSCERGGRGR